MRARARFASIVESGVFYSHSESFDNLLSRCQSWNQPCQTMLSDDYARQSLERALKWAFDEDEGTGMPSCFVHGRAMIVRRRKEVLPRSHLRISLSRLLLPQPQALVSVRDYPPLDVSIAWITSISQISAARKKSLPSEFELSASVDSGSA